MQASTQSQAAGAPAQLPSATAPQAQAPRVSITTVGPGGTTQTLEVPKTRAEVEELLTQRSELSSQLINVTGRRRELSEEIRSAPEGASRAGLEDRLRLLDQRILQIETDIATTGRQLAMAPASLTSSEFPSGGGGGGDETGEILAVLTVLAIPVIAFVYWWRRRRRRRGVAKSQPQFQGESAQRLERLEQGMDAIAVEIERISEGQRFVTKLLAESHSPVGVANRTKRPRAASAVDDLREE